MNMIISLSRVTAWVTKKKNTYEATSETAKAFVATTEVAAIDEFGISSEGTTATFNIDLEIRPG